MEYVVPQTTIDDISNNKTHTKMSSKTKQHKGIATNPSSESIETIINNRFYYSVGKLNLLLEQDIKAENLSQPKIYEIPHPPSWCSGIVNVRGNIVPVVNMHILLKTGERTSTKHSKLLLFHHDSLSPIIFQIDKLPSMINFDNYTSKMLPDNSADWMTQLFQYESNIIYEVNHINLLKKLTTNHH